MAYENDRSRDRLASFLVTLRDDLEWVVDNCRTVLPGYRQQFYTNVTEAWDVVYGEFDRRAQRLRDEQAVSADDLIDHGLDGPQLALKLDAVRARREPVAFIQNNWAEVRDFEDAVRMTFIGDALRSYFETLERILESILDAIGAAGSIAEFKDLIEQSIPE